MLLSLVRHHLHSPLDMISVEKFVKITIIWIYTTNSDTSVDCLVQLKPRGLQVGIIMRPR